MDLVLAELFLPKGFAILNVQGCGVGSSIVDKVQVHTFSIGRQRTVGVCGLFVLFIELAFVDFSTPNLLPSAAVKGDGILCLLLFIGSQQKDLIASHNRRSVAAALNPDLPFEVLGYVDLLWQNLRTYSGTIMIGASPPRPVIGMSLGSLGGKGFVKGFFGNCWSELGLRACLLSKETSEKKQGKEFGLMMGHNGDGMK